LTNGSWVGTLYKDNSFIAYDQGGKNWIINLQGQITLTTVGNVGNTVGGTYTIASKANCTINGMIIDPSGNVTIPGTLTVAGISNLNAGGTATPKMTNSDGSGGGS
jgi:phage baseplate assembly protein gpV